MQRVSRILSFRSISTTISSPTYKFVIPHRFFSAAHAPSTSASADAHGHSHNGAHDDHGHGHGHGHGHSGDPRNESHVFGEHSVSIKNYFYVFFSFSSI